MEFLERFGWTNKLLTETEKQAVEDIQVEYHDIFASHRMDTGMNREFSNSHRRTTKLSTAKTYQGRSI